MTAEPHKPQPNSESPSVQARADVVERLFREHNQALMNFLLARVRSYQEAREVAQEAYVRLLSLDETGAISYLRAFLFRTAANIAIDRQRHAHAHKRAIDLPLFQEFADGRTPERQVAGQQAVRALESLVAALPPKCQRAFVLYQFHGVDFASIALDMGISERMVRKYVERALLECRQRLDMERS